MEGSFRQRGCKCPLNRKRCSCGAKWYYRYDITDPVTGNRKQKETKGYSTKKEAEAEAKRIQYELQTGTYVEEKNITFERFAEDWLKTYRNTGVKDGTIRLRTYGIKFLNKHFGKLKLKEVTQKKYQAMLDELFNLERSHETITSYHSTGTMIFRKAMELEMIKKNPTEFIEVPKKQITVEELEQEAELPKYLEKEVLTTFLKSISKHWMDIRDYPLFYLLAYTGLRAGELSALKWTDINVEEQTISIRRSVYSEDGKVKNYKLVTPKTKGSIRTIDIDESVLIELEKYRPLQNEIRMKHRDIYHDQQFVFAEIKRNQAGYPIPPRLIRDRMKIFLKRAGIVQDNLTPHSLRHTHTSLLAEAGVSLEQIMQRLGHTNDSTTKLVYLHVTKPKRKEASQKFADLMKSVK